MFVYLVFDISRTAGGDKNSGQFTSSHGGGDVQGRISVLISSTNHFILKNKEKKRESIKNKKNYKNKRETFVVVVVVTLFCSETLHWALTRMRITPA